MMIVKKMMMKLRLKDVDPRSVLFVSYSSRTDIVDSFCISSTQALSMFCVVAVHWFIDRGKERSYEGAPYIFVVIYSLINTCVANVT